MPITPNQKNETIWNIGSKWFSALSRKRRTLTNFIKKIQKKFRAFPKFPPDSRSKKPISSPETPEFRTSFFSRRGRLDGFHRL